jgi:tyrosyl-tRNA synthetase
MASSKSEARRLIIQKGVRLGGALVSEVNLALDLGAPEVLQVGKRKFIRLVPEKK